MCRKLPEKFGKLLSEDQLKQIEELGLLADLDDQVSPVCQSQLSSCLDRQEHRIASAALTDLQICYNDTVYIKGFGSFLSALLLLCLLTCQLKSLTDWKMRNSMLQSCSLQTILRTMAFAQPLSSTLLHCVRAGHTAASVYKASRGPTNTVFGNHSADRM